MAFLRKNRAAAAGDAAESPDDAAPGRACAACGAAMQRGQDWCLECGTAAAGRIGGPRPGWRAAFSVVGVTSLLLCSGVVAAYAALTSDAERSASQPSAGSADPIVAQTPGAVAAPPTTGTVIQPGVTGPGVTAPPPPVFPTTPLPPVTPPAPVVTQPPPPPPTTTTPPPAAPAQVERIAFAKDAAKTYDPLQRAGAEFGPAENAIDDKPRTVWDVVVPADGEPIAAGLVIDLGRPYALRSLRIATPTKGFTVEVYGATSAKELPEDVIDKRWIHLTNKRHVKDGGLIRLKGKGDGAKVQLLLLHITQPAEPTDPRVAIGDVVLRGTP